MGIKHGTSLKNMLRLAASEVSASLSREEKDLTDFEAFIDALGVLAKGEHLYSLKELAAQKHDAKLGAEIDTLADLLAQYQELRYERTKHLEVADDVTITPPGVTIPKDQPDLVVKGRRVFRGSESIYNGGQPLGFAIREARATNDGTRAVIAIDEYCEASEIKPPKNTPGWKRSPVNIVPFGAKNAYIQKRDWKGDYTLGIFPGVDDVSLYDIGIELSPVGAGIKSMGRAANVAPTSRWNFFDCYTVGEFDHATNSGPRSKWIFQLSMVADWKIIGGEYSGCEEEHFLYSHNLQGDFHVRGVTSKRLGRTFCQFTSRYSESNPGLPAGKGTIIVSDNIIADTGISMKDARHGGSTLTVAGRHLGNVHFLNNSVAQGFDAAYDLDGNVVSSYPGLAAALQPAAKGGIIGNGLVAIWRSPKVAENNQYVEISGNRLHQNAVVAGSSAVMSLDGTDTIEVRNNDIRAGANGYAAHWNRKGEPPVKNFVWENNETHGALIKKNEKVWTPS